MTGLKKIAYHTGEYPRATDTFIQREVAGIRACGVDVITCSVRRTTTQHHVGPEQQAEYANTFYVLEKTKDILHLIRSHLSLIGVRPKAYLSALKLAVKTSLPGLVGGVKQAAYFAEAGVLAAHLRQQGVQHLHNHFANSSCSVAMLASEMSGIPFSVTMHGPAIFFEPMKWRIDEKIARAKFISCISHFCRSQGMIFADPVHWSRMHIVHCGVDPSRYGLTTKTPDAKGRTRLLFVGRLAAVKGLPVLMDALHRLGGAEGSLQLTVIGDGGERKNLEARAAQLGLSDVVQFVGYKSQAEVANALQSTDIFVLPSFAEGVPVVLMEALAARTPVIATRIAGIGELVEEGVSGLSVPPGDVEALANALRQLADDPQLRARMGEAGREKVCREYDVSREAAWLCRLMETYHSPTVAQPGLRPDDPART